MLRIHKYNDVKKSNGINYLLKFYKNNSTTVAINIDFTFINKKEVYINNLYIKRHEDYDIIKEQILECYIMNLKDIIIIHLTQEFIKDFEFLYKNSKEYTFDMYQTQEPDFATDDIIVSYHIFCTSKKLSDKLDYISFLNTNDSHTQYTCLTFFYGPCIVLNRRFNVLLPHEKFNAKYKYIKSIGKGDINKDVKSIVNRAIEIANNYQQILPPHYLKPI